MAHNLVEECVNTSVRKSPSSLVNFLPTPSCLKRQSPLAHLSIAFASRRRRRSRSGTMRDLSVPSYSGSRPPESSNRAPLKLRSTSSSGNQPPLPWCPPPRGPRVPRPRSCPGGTAWSSPCPDPAHLRRGGARPARAQDAR